MRILNDSRLTLIKNTRAQTERDTCGRTKTIRKRYVRVDANLLENEKNKIPYDRCGWGLILLFEILHLTISLSPGESLRDC